jgi:hypothetical protein
MPIFQTDPATDTQNALINAKRNADSGALAEIESSAPGTEFGEEAKIAKQIVNKNLALHDEVMTPITQAGGINTPEGRLIASEQFRSYKDNPSIGKWFIHALMGDPKARVYAGGGQTITSYKYGNNGQLIRVDRDELGNIEKAYNMNTNKPVSQQEYAQLQADGDIGKAITEERLKNKIKFDQDSANKENLQANAYSSFADKAIMAGEEKKRLSQELIASGLNDKQVAHYVSFGNQTVNNATSLSRASDKLNSLSKGKGSSFDESEQKGLKASLGGAFYPFDFGSHGELVKKDGSSLTQTDLDQLQKHVNESIHKESNYTRTNLQAALGKVFENLSASQQDRILRLMEVDSNYQKDLNNLKSDYGDLPFLINTDEFNALTSPNRANAQAESMIHNGTIVKAYKQFRDQAMEDFERLGHVPTAGEIMSGFVKSPVYQNASKLVKEKIIKALSPELIQTNATVEPIEPKQVKQVEAPQVRKTNAPKKKRSPQEIINGVLNKD